MTKIISVVSGKGGSGKSSLIINLASYLHCNTKLKIGLVDADAGQHSVWMWAGLRKEKSRIFDMPVFKIENPYEILEVKKEASDLDVLLVDTGGHGHATNDLARQSIIHSDGVLVPCQPSLFDLSASKESMDLAMKEGKPCTYILTRCDMRSNIHQEFQEWMKSENLPVLKQVMGESIEYKRLLPEGECVSSKHPWSVQGRHIAKICTEVFDLDGE